MTCSCVEKSFMNCVGQTVSCCLIVAVIGFVTEVRAATYAFTYSDKAGDAATGQLTVQAGIGDSVWATGGTMHVTASSDGFYGVGQYNLESSSGTTLIGPGSLTHQGTNAYVVTYVLFGRQSCLPKL